MYNKVIHAKITDTKEKIFESIKDNILTLTLI